MPEILDLTRFGNPVLREPARRLTKDEILSDEVQTLIENMYYTLKERQYGVGLAAPQVGARVALSVLGIKPTPNRPNLTPFETVLINPEVIETHGEPAAMWEGCVSSGSDDNTLFAQVPRFERVTLRWVDERAEEHEEELEGFVAHVAQHETDHLNGILFVDRVEDTTTFMLADEYRKRIVHK
jgi:peptide deformylase